MKEKKKIKVTVALGALDNSNVTQEELDKMIQALENMTTEEVADHIVEIHGEDDAEDFDENVDLIDSIIILSVKTQEPYTNGN